MQLIVPGGVDFFNVDPIPAPNGYAYPDPSEADIVQALDAMSRAEVEYVILVGSDENLYIQAAGERQGPYTLEVQWGALERHFVARAPAPTLAGVHDAFLAFARGEYQWQSLYSWERVQF